MTRTTVLCFLLLAVALPAGAQDVPETAGPTGSQAPPTSEEELLETADEIAEKVGKIRGLEAKGPFKKGIKKREELRAVLVSKLAEEVSDDDIAAEAKVYKRLGVIPQDLDYKKVLLDVLTEQIAGFYDQTTKELYIMEGIPLGLQRPAMAHEIFHALQDQHFDILAMQEPFSTMENSDFALARSALLEGDATVLMFDFSLYEQGQLPQGNRVSLVDIPFAANMLTQLSFDDLAGMEQLAGSFGGADFAVGESALSKAPAIFRESLVFPYFAGMRFIVMARSGRTWAEVDEIYENPPVSTEQIIHPERYFAGDEPVHLSFRAEPALPGYRKIYDSVLGEFQILQFLKAHEPQGISPAKAAEGWDGDRVLAFEREDGSVALVLLTAWDEIAEAEEFYRGLVQISQQRYPDARIATAAGKHGESTCASLEGERLYVERWGNYVLYIEGTPSELSEKGAELDPATYQLRELVWKTFEEIPFREHMERALAEKAAEPKKSSQR